MKSILRRLSLTHVVVVLAVALVLGTGSAYAANQISSKNIKNNSVKSVDIKDGSLTGADLADGGVSAADVLDATLTGADIKDGSIGSADITDSSVTSADVAANSLTADDLAPNSVTQSEIATDGVAATEIQDNSIDSGEIIDFGLSNQDIGVLFAQVNANGTIANSSGGVTGLKLGAAGTGNYEIDFGLDISGCAFTATVGPATFGSATGEVNVADRAANAEAVFVDTNESGGAAADLPFQLVVVC